MRGSRSPLALCRLFIPPGRRSTSPPVRRSLSSWAEVGGLQLPLALALLRPSVAVGAPHATVPAYGIFGLLICIAGARLTDSRGSHAFELGALCGSAESDLITPLSKGCGLSRLALGGVVAPHPLSTIAVYHTPYRVSRGFHLIFLSFFGKTLKIRK